MSRTSSQVRKAALKSAARSQALTIDQGSVRREIAPVLNPSVFVSYARSDMALVQPFVAALRARGVNVVWDQDLPAGVNFAIELTHAIAAAACVIVVWSDRAATSRFVCDEAQLAADAGKLVPTHVNGFEPAMVQLGLRGFQVIPLGDDARLLASLARFGVVAAQ